MIQIFIDYATNKIIGYNTIIPDNTADVILVEDDCIQKLSNINIFDNLYYENGEIVEKEEPDSSYMELRELSVAESSATDNVKNEHRIFMDNLLSGMSLEDATAVTKKNRELLENILERKKAFDMQHESRRTEAVSARFAAEEKNIENKYFLSIVTTVRDENEYIEEWISYHVENMGVEHFYIYDNESEISLKEYLESVKFKYLDKVTIIEWATSEHTQQDTCNDWLKNYGSETKWFICMDVDEFINLKDKSKTLVEFLEENSDYASIKCLWKHYTANGQEKKTGKAVTERFTQETDWGDEKHGGKLFAQSNRISHFISYVPQVRLQTQKLEHDSEKVTNFFQLNHYITKSYEEWVEKIERGSVNPNYFRKYQEFFEINPDMQYLNTGEDYAQGYSSGKKEDSEN